MDAYVEVLGDNPCPSIRQLRELLTPALAVATGAGVDDDVVRAFKDFFFANECLFATADGHMGVSRKRPATR
jgi:hypothetical protein